MALVVCTRLHQALHIAGSGGDSIFLHPFLHAQNRPDLLSPLYSPLQPQSGEGEKPKRLSLGSQSATLT